MGPLTTQLCQKLRETSALLESVGESFWAKWAAEARGRLEQSDVSGADLVLDAYGGMGSFNDLVLMAVNGHLVTDENEYEVNVRLDALRSQLCELAAKVRRNAVIEDE